MEELFAWISMSIKRSEVISVYTVDVSSWKRVMSITMTFIEESIENRKIISDESDYNGWKPNDEAMNAIKMDK